MKGSGQSVKQLITVKSKLFLKTFRQENCKAFPNSKPRIISLFFSPKCISFINVMFNQKYKSLASFFFR